MSDKIRVYRQYITEKMLNAKTMEVTSHYYLWVPKNKQLWVYPMDGYLSSLEVKNSDDESLPVLSDHELNMLIQNPIQRDVGIFADEIITQNTMHEEMLKQDGNNNNQPIKDKTKKAKHYVGIILPKVGSDHFDEIIIKWVKFIPIEKKASDLISLQISGEHEISKTTTASTYLDLQLDDKKYEFVGDPSIIVTKKDGKEDLANCDDIKEIFHTKKRIVFRIKRDNDLQFLIKWSIGIPRLIQRWAWGGFIASIAIMLLSLLTFFFGDEKLTDVAFQFNVRLLAGAVGLIVSFRVLLFHDTDLMARWNHLYLLLLASTLAIILGMYAIITFDLIK